MLTVHLGRSKKDQHWVRQSFPTREAFIDKWFRKFERGVEDSWAITQGELVGMQRRGKAVRANYIIMLDFDNGVPLDAIADDITAAGYGAILWNTHSHLRPTTDISDSALTTLRKEPDLAEATAHELCLEWMRRKGIVQSIIDSVTDVRSEHTEEGVRWFVDHAPMHRCRALFFLAEPFQFSQ